MKHLLASLAFAGLIGQPTGAVAQELAAPEAAETAQTRDMIAQARGMLRQAPLTTLQQLGFQSIEAGRLDVAILVADEIIARAPDDSFGHFLRAQVFLRSGAPERAVPAARAAFHAAQTDVQKFQSARVAAMGQTARARYLPAQIWMRRALQAAPDAQSREQAAQEFRSVRRASDLTLNFSLSVSPSDNVNNGANSDTFVVDGIPLVGRLSADAQALSGVETRTEARLSYRLHQSARSETRAHASLGVKGVSLSDEARDKAPEANGRDYGHTIAEIGASHRQVLQDGGPILGFGATLGRVWFGGAPGYNTRQAQISLTQPLWTGGYARLGYSRQIQSDAYEAYPDILTATWQLGLGQTLGNGDQLGVVVFEGETDAESARQQRVSRGVTLYYDREAPVGPFDLAASLTGRETHYADYPFLLGVPVPGGRWDSSLSAKIDVGLPNLSYLGFMPTVSITRERTTSNVSRFETDATGISLGFRSEF